MEAPGDGEREMKSGVVKKAVYQFPLFLFSNLY